MSENGDSARQRFMAAVAEGMDAVDMKVASDVDRLGWSDIAVFPTETDPPGTRPFNYTVGLAERNHPDLIITGMNNQQAHGVLAVAVDRIFSDSARFEADSISDLILVDYPVAFIRVADPLAEPCPMTMVRRFYGTVDALQLVWPDKQRRFPWDKGCHHGVHRTQRLLGEWMGA